MNSSLFCSIKDEEPQPDHKSFYSEHFEQFVTSTDFIGIVPGKFLARYCHSLFLKEDKIIDFMNPGFDNEIIPKIIEKAFWYPPDAIILA